MGIKRGQHFKYNTYEKNIILLIALGLMSQMTGHLNAQNKFEKIHLSLNGATAFTTGDTLTVSTRKVERKWLLTDCGLRTISFKDLSNGKEYCQQTNGITSDWDLPGAIQAGTKGKLLSADIRQSDDDGFLNDFLEVVTHFRYDSAQIELQHVIWVFPDAPGVRTQLRVKALENSTRKDFRKKKPPGFIVGTLWQCPVQDPNISRSTTA